MEYTVTSLKKTAKAVREALKERGITVKSAATRSLWAYTLAGHQKFESLVEQARRDSYISLLADPTRMVEWCEAREKPITRDVAESLINEVLGDQEFPPRPQYRTPGGLTVKVYDSDAYPAFQHYPSQDRPQRAFVRMDKDGYVDVGYDLSLDGNVAPEEQRLLTLTWDILPELNGEDINNLLRHLAPFLERVHAGHKYEWDGHAVVGQITEEAFDAYTTITEVLMDIEPTYPPITVETMIARGVDLKRVWLPQMSLQQVVKTLQTGSTPVVGMVGDVRDGVIYLARIMFNGSPDVPEHIVAALFEEGEIGFSELMDYCQRTGLEFPITPPEMKFDEDTEVYVVEVPRTGSPSAFATTRGELVKIALEVDVFEYDYFTPHSAEQAFGEDRVDWPEGLEVMLAEYPYVIRRSLPGGIEQLFAPLTADSLYDSALNVLGSELSAFHAFDSLDALEAFVANTRSTEIRVAAAHLLANYRKVVGI